jgi:hypothetical protein
MSDQTQAPAEAPEFSFAEALQALVNKRVRVHAKKMKSIDQAPGEAPDKDGFFYVDYFGTVLNPAVRPYPENNPSGIPSLYIQTWDARQQIYAIALDVIEDVDDEIAPDAPIHVSMTGLTSPTAPQ